MFRKNQPEQPAVATPVQPSEERVISTIGLTPAQIRLIALGVKAGIDMTEQGNHDGIDIPLDSPRLPAINTAAGAQPSSAEKPKSSAGRRVRRLGVATLTAGVLAAGGTAAATRNIDPELPPDYCTDKTHGRVIAGIVDGLPYADKRTKLQSVLGGLPAMDELELVQNSRSLEQIAEDLSSRRGYVVTAAGLAKANATVVDERDPTGSVVRIIDEMTGEPVEELPTGVYCFAIPAPIVPGQTSADGKMTLVDYAAAFQKKPEDLVRLNPQLSEASLNETPVPAGTILWLDEKPDITAQLVLRPITETEAEAIRKASPAEQMDFFKKNGPLLGIKEPEAGDVAYMPSWNAATQASASAAPSQPTPSSEAPSAAPSTSSQAIPPSTSGAKNVLAELLETYVGQNAYNFEAVQVAPQGEAGHGDEHQAPTPEAPAITLSPEQKDIISKLNLNDAQKQSLEAMLIATLQVKDQAKGVNMEVMLAQAVLETGWGSSELATKYHNYFGMKAGNNWHGAVTPLMRQSEGGEGVFRAYESTYAGFQGYLDKIDQSEWYDDARAAAATPAGYIDGLQSEPGKPFGAEGALSWAQNPAYKQHLLDIIKNYRFTELLAQAPSRPAPTEVVVAPKDDELSFNFKLKKDKQPSMTPEDVAHLEHELNAMRLSKEGYEAFVKNIQDVRKQAKDKVIQTRQNGAQQPFNGDKNGYGRPRNVKQDVKYFIAHITAAGNNGLDGLGFAGSMGQYNLGVQYYMNDEGTVWWLTDDYTAHISEYNQMAYGVEVAAPKMGAVRTKQLESLVYLAIHHMAQNGYLENAATGLSVQGHHETASNPDGHTDMPKVAMDPVRQAIAQLLPQLGYTAKYDFFDEQNAVGS